jgi:putative SOS response-associated peptidase YedK
MCGRKTLTKDMRSIIEELAIEEWENPENYIPNYNIAPTQKSPILIDNGKRTVRPMRWGLIPSWAKDEKFASKMINARIETLAEKPSYRNLLTQNRCVVITDGYYEWKKEGDKKYPYYIKDPHDNLLPMAGLYDVWKNSEGQIVPTYTVITKASQDEIAEIHGRMPVVLPKNELDIWLRSHNNDTKNALQFANDFKPILEKYPISSLVNSVSNNSPECVRPL